MKDIKLNDVKIGEEYGEYYAIINDDEMVSEVLECEENIFKEKEDRGWGKIVKVRITRIERTDKDE